MINSTWTLYRFGKGQTYGVRERMERHLKFLRCTCFTSMRGRRIWNVSCPDICRLSGEVWGRGIFLCTYICVNSETQSMIYAGIYMYFSWYMWMWPKLCLTLKVAILFDFHDTLWMFYLWYTGANSAVQPNCCRVLSAQTGIKFTWFAYFDWCTLSDVCLEGTLQCNPETRQCYYQAIHPADSEAVCF